ncbi:NADPH:quinone reductase [Hydrogenophaga sp. R2]|uniref:NADPH:quinone reductase n=1 Tax=Hydrogenophaga sp. R2 TaxID=3132827 RepID=UPI003CE92410
MQAAWYERNGPADEVLVVGEMPTPEPGPGEVRVRLAWSGVNPSDVKSRARRPLIAPRIVPHSDGSGVIDAVGAGVPAARLGQRVWTWNAQWKRPMGTAAGFVTLPSEQAVDLPASVSLEAGACLGIPGLTAVQAVRLAAPQPGQTVLVTGAGNAVGHLVVQLARRLGARVIGTAGSDARRALALQSGAIEVVDYRQPEAVRQVLDLTGGAGVDLVIDMDFSGTAAWLPQGVLRPHGRVVCYGSNNPGEVTVDFRTLLFQSIACQFFVVYELTPGDRAACIAELRARLEAGQLDIHTGAQWALTDIAHAHRCVESGASLGTVLVAT